MIKEMEKFKLNHNQFDAGTRGVWRKFNPYNPYQGNNENQEKDLKIDSLDDLFEDNSESNNDIKQETRKSMAPKNNFDVNSLDELLGENPKEKNSDINNNSISDSELDELLSDDYDNGDENNVSNSEMLDIQKELEAKFDELFGTSDNS